MEQTVRDTWLNSLTECVSIRAALTDVTGSGKVSSEHVEVSVSRI